MKQVKQVTIIYGWGQTIKTKSDDNYSSKLLKWMVQR